MQSLIVQHDLELPLPDEERHFVTAKDLARLECGCTVYVGRRVDDGQAATVARACGRDHAKTVIVRFNDAMRATLPSKSTEPLIDVVARILLDAA